MARMIPPRLSSDIKSNAEKKVFEFFKNDPAASGYAILHSLGLARHVKRQYGEIDFVILAPGEGVFCLEVKGGRVKRKAGVWTFTNQYNETTTKTVSPFTQAREGMFSLLEAIRKQFGSHHRLYNLVFRYGVMFPDIEFTDVDPEFERWEIYDLRDRKFPVSEYVKRLSRGAHRQVASTQWYNPAASRPTEKDIAELINFLRGDFEKIPPPSVELDETEQMLLTLTEEQYERLDSLEENDRCLFEGGAGTGKTMIAVEFARREATRGRRVGIFCYNKLLSGQIKHSVSGISEITIATLHKFMRDFVVSSDLKEEFLAQEKNAAAEDLYDEIYPLYAATAVREKPDFEPFDTLIIDEAQDLITPENLDFFDEILRGGLNGGVWAMFADFHRQAIYSKFGKDEMLAALRQRAPHFTVCKLMRNCRNTKNIGEETASVSGFAKPPFHPTAIDGVPVDYQFYAGAEDQTKKIETLLKKLIADGIQARKITVLSPKAAGNSCFPALQKLNSIKVKQISDSFFDGTSANEITFATIHSFKGLENSIIVLTDAEDLINDKARSLLYVGMSRAKQRLYMILSENLREQYQSLLNEKLKQSVKNL